MKLREQILEEEAQFADQHYRPHTDDLSINPRMFERYRKPKRMWDWRQKGASMLGPVDGKRLLDLGCGMGEESVYFAKLGAHVTAIDISPVGVEITRNRASHNDVAANVQVKLMAADPTEFVDESFDIVHGFGILHHIGLEKGLAEVKRLLRPAGVGLFHEPLGNSTLVDRLKVIAYGGREHLDYTEDEKPLTFEALDIGASHFTEFRYYPYHLTFRLRKLTPPSLSRASEVFDFYLMRIIRPLRWFAGGAVIFLRK